MTGDTMGWKPNGVATHQNTDLDGAPTTAMIVEEYGLDFSPETVRFISADHGQKGHKLPEGFIAVDVFGSEDDGYHKGRLDDGSISSSFWDRMVVMFDLDGELEANTDEELPVPRMVIKLIDQIDRGGPYTIQKAFGLEESEDPEAFYRTHDAIYRTTMADFFLAMKNAKFTWNLPFKVDKTKKKDYIIVMLWQKIYRGMKMVKQDGKALDFRDVDKLLTEALLQICKIKEAEVKNKSGIVSVQVEEARYKSSRKEGYACCFDLCNEHGTPEMNHAFEDLLQSMNGYYREVPYLSEMLQDIDIMALANYYYLGCGKNMEETLTFLTMTLRGILGNHQRREKMIKNTLDEKKFGVSSDIGIVVRKKGDPSMTDFAHRLGAKVVCYIDGNNLGFVRRHGCKLDMFQVLKPFLEEAGELDEWHNDPRGFIVCRGSGKAKQKTKSGLANNASLLKMARAFKAALKKEANN